MKKIFTMLLVCAIILSALMLSGCGKNDEIAGADNKTEAAEFSISESSGDIEVSTEYVVLHYPAAWEEFLHITRECDGETESVKFYGEVEEHEKELLFEVLFNSDDGVALGKLSKDGTEVSVSMNVPEFEFDDTWNENEQTTLYAMQEDVNFVIQNMNEADGFTPAN